MQPEVIEIDPKRLAKIKCLDHGSHQNLRDGMCVMEAVAYVARLPFSDHPECVCPVIGAFLRSWNDALPRDDRTALLLPLIPKVLNTRGSRALEERRSMMAADWLIRTHAVAWLRVAGLTPQADALANLPEITSMAQIPSLRGPIEAARDIAAVARDVARAAAWDAAWDAARAAAWAAARAVAWAAWDAAWDAARAVAGAAAWDAAWAAGDKIEPTKRELQASALALVERMCAATGA